MNSDNNPSTNPAVIQPWQYFSSSPKADGSFKSSVPFGFTGEMKMWPVVSPPAGWLICDGSLLKKEDYPDLWALLGDAWGTPTTTHFYIPDMRGRVPVGRDVSQTEFDTIAEAGGDKNMPAHRHDTIDQALYSGFDNNIVIGGSYGPTAGLVQGGSAYRVGNTSMKTSSTGSGSSGNLPPYKVVQYIIKF